MPDSPLIWAGQIVSSDNKSARAGMREINMQINCILALSLGRVEDGICNNLRKPSASKFYLRFRIGIRIWSLIFSGWFLVLLLRAL